MIGLVRLLRDHGDAVEADLAFRGVDIRDLWRPGSGLTLRRLLVLIRALPPDAEFWRAYAGAEQQASKPTVDQIRERQAHYAAKIREEQP